MGKSNYPATTGKDWDPGDAAAGRLRSLSPYISVGIFSEFHQKSSERVRRVAVFSEDGSNIDIKQLILHKKT